MVHYFTKGTTELWKINIESYSLRQLELREHKPSTGTMWRCRTTSLHGVRNNVPWAASICQLRRGSRCAGHFPSIQIFHHVPQGHYNPLFWSGSWTRYASHASYPVHNNDINLFTCINCHHMHDIVYEVLCWYFVAWRYSQCRWLACTTLEQASSIG